MYKFTIREPTSTNDRNDDDGDDDDNDGGEFGTFTKCKKAPISARQSTQGFLNLAVQTTASSALHMFIASALELEATTFQPPLST